MSFSHWDVLSNSELVGSTRGGKKRKEKHQKCGTVYVWETSKKLL